MSNKYERDSLKYQWRLYGAVARSSWATSLDKSIAYEIIDNYRKDQGNSRTSLRFLEQATGSTRPNIIVSTRRLVDYGAFSVARLGKGTRPTEYNLNFDLVAEKTRGIADNTSNDNSPTGIAYDTSCGIAGDTSTDASGIACDTESDLRNRPTAGLRVGRNLIARRSAVAGLEAATQQRDQGQIKEPFDLFWLAFSRKHNRRKAEAAWATIAPDAELVAKIVDAARALSAHYVANPTEKKWMRHAHNWLHGKGWTEDLPEVYENLISRPKALRAPKGAVRRDVTVVAIEEGEHGTSVVFDFNDCRPGEAPSTKRMYGKAEMVSLCAVAGVECVGVRLFLDAYEDKIDTFALHEDFQQTVAA